jgi:uncharacterized membrane protein
MIDVFYDIHTHHGHIVLQPNRAASWRVNRLFLIVLAVLCLGIGGVFALFGAWLILPFAGLEVLAVTVRVCYVFNRNRRQEVVRFSETEVVVETGRHVPQQAWRCQRPWCRLQLVATSHPWYPPRLILRCHQREIELGGFLNQADRHELHGHLQQILHRV